MGSRRPSVWILIRAHLRGDPKKTAVLVLLSIVMVGVYARLFLSISKGGPQEVSAADVAPTAVPTVSVDDTPPSGARAKKTRVRLDRPLVRKLSRDPFTLGSDFMVDSSSANGQATDEARSLDPVQRARAAAAALVLESTLCGSMPLAAISGRVVRPGEKIDGFVLERIEPNRVILRRHEVRVVLPLRNTRE